MTICSCRFSRPLISLRTSKDIKIDSLTKTKTVTKKVLRFSLMHLEIIGLCKIYNVYDSNDVLIMRIISKYTRGHCADCRRFAGKKKYFDSNGHLTQVDYTLGQEGYFTKIIVDKSVFYSNGKRTYKKNNNAG